MTWWQGAAVYEVYVRSFADGSGDGVGDLPGLRSRLPYLQWLGVDAIWITPFYRSPMVDHGYDVEDPRDVDPLFGSLDDFDALLADAHDVGLRVLVDVIPNHTSDQHPWFREALAHPTTPARDRYIFRPPAPDGGPPNNWQSVFGGPAWSLDPASGEYWLHLFAPEQPDLNWRNPEVAADAEATLRFWLDRGVDGFRIDVAHGLYKDAALRDNPLWPDPPEGISSFSRMEQRHTFDQPEVHDVYRHWRRIVEQYDQEPVLLGEVFLWDPQRVAQYVRPDELHLAFSFLLLGQPFEADKLRRAISLSIGEDQRGEETTAWAFSNHDLARHATRFGGGATGQRRARATALLLLALPGTPILYAGEELGLEDVTVPAHCRQDPIWFRSGGQTPGRDGCRVPFPWTTEGPGLGFTDGSPWLPVPAGWGERSVAAQQDDPASMLTLYRQALVCRRRERALRRGSFSWLASPPGTVAFERAHHGSTVTVLVNTAGEEVAVRADGDLLLASDPAVRRRGTCIVLPADTAAWVIRGDR